MKKKTHYTTEDIRKILRLTDRGADIWHPAEAGDITFDGVYHVTLHDLRAALQAIIDQNLTADDVITWWDLLNDTLYDGLGPKDVLNEEKGYRYQDEVPWYDFPDNESGVLFRLWHDLIGSLVSDCYEIEDNPPVGQMESLHDAAAYIDCYLNNQHQPKEKWQYPDFMMEYFIDCFDDDNTLAEAADAEKKRFAAWVDLLADKENPRALHARCYGQYTGNAVYAQDFTAARDDAEKLFALTRNPQYANTLGYIHYYGRCTGGEPEYDKALTCFTFGAANGLYESIYKLADMYKNGYGVIKSPETAYRLVDMLYRETCTEYEKGNHDGKFADVALRLGSMILHGVGAPQNIRNGIAVLLQAEYAIKRRIAEGEHYGDNVVAANIARALGEAKEICPPGKNTGKNEDAYFWAIDRLMGDGYRLGFRARKLENGAYSVSFHRLPKRGEAEPKKTFFVIPRIYYCDFTDTIRGHVNPVGGEMPAFGTADDFNIVYESGQAKTIFYYDSKPVFTLKGNSFDWRFPKPKAKSGKTVRLVGITFTPGGRQYDYRCDDEDVKAGDTVIVMGYDGEQSVTVQNVRLVPVEDLVLPLEKYKTARKNHEQQS